LLISKELPSVLVLQTRIKKKH